MVDDDLLKLLRCPETHAELLPADESLITRANQQVAAGQLKTIGGHAVTKPLDGGLVRSGGDLLYPIIEGIPVMLHDEAIAVSSL